MSGQSTDLRETVRRRYAAAARQVTEGGTACCGPEAIEIDENFGSTLYAAGECEALPAEAVAASLGYGNPTAVADLREGERVLDLGSGGGIDVLLSARRARPSASSSPAAASASPTSSPTTPSPPSNGPGAGTTSAASPAPSPSPSTATGWRPPGSRTSRSPRRTPSPTACTPPSSAPPSPPLRPPRPKRPPGPEHQRRRSALFQPLDSVRRQRRRGRVALVATLHPCARAGGRLTDNERRVIAAELRCPPPPEATPGRRKHWRAEPAEPGNVFVMFFQTTDDE